MNDEHDTHQSPSNPTPRKEKRLRRPKPPAPVRIPQETVDSSWRLFIAVPLPNDVVTFVDRTISALKSEPWPVKWIDPGNAHITLHFLGEVDPATADLLRIALHGTIEANEAFALRTADLGAFPTIRRPRVLWLGLYGPAHRLETIREGISQTLKDLEFEQEDREFHPHITLGRVRSDRNMKVSDLPLAIRERFDRALATGEVTNKKPVALPIDEIQLIRSRLGPHGYSYEILERYPLRPAEPKKKKPEESSTSPDSVSDDTSQDTLRS